MFQPVLQFLCNRQCGSRCLSHWKLAVRAILSLECNCILMTIDTFQRARGIASKLVINIYELRRGCRLLSCSLERTSNISTVWKVIFFGKCRQSSSWLYTFETHCVRNLFLKAWYSQAISESAGIAQWLIRTVKTATACAVLGQHKDTE